MTDEQTSEDIFISYKRERRRAAEHLFCVLECHGYTAWYDYNLFAGQDFATQLEAKIDAVKAVLVLWCSKSVTSEWVLREAQRAKEREVLLPAVIERCNVPDDYALLHTLNLIDWDGSARSETLDPLWIELERRTGRVNTTLQRIRRHERTWKLYNTPSLRAMAEEPVQGITVMATGTPAIDVNSAWEAARKRYERAASAWPSVRDSVNLNTLRGFALEFDGTPQAAQALDLIRHIERGASTLSQPVGIAPPNYAEVASLKSAGRIRVAAREVHGVRRDRDGGWFLPGNGKTEWFKDHDAAPEMVVVPAGSYWRESGTDPYEVHIAHPFAISRTAVTFETWDAAHRLSAFTAHVPDDMSWGRANHPVIHVSWADAVAYCRWLERVTGHIYRLPTESEWDYTCLAGGSNASASDMLTSHDANFDARCRGERGTKPVRSYPSNAWGLYECYGNVWEWVIDSWQAEEMPPAPRDGSERLALEGEYRVMKGGSWLSNLQALRGASSHYALAETRDYNIGFRVVRSL